MTNRRFALSLLAGFTVFAAASVPGARGTVSAQTPSPTGEVAVQVTLQAGPTAAARTWRFEIVNTAGVVLQTLSLGTSGGALTSTETASGLPFGVYTVRQILGNDTKTACDAKAFYEVTSPISAQLSVGAGASRTTALFTIRPCPALPANLQLLAPIDTIAPSPTPAAPIDEVRGSRNEGPGAPLPPATGSSSASPAPAPRPSLMLVIFGVALTLAPSAGFALAHARRRSK